MGRTLLAGLAVLALLSAAWTAYDRHNQSRPCLVITDKWTALRCKGTSAYIPPPSVPTTKPAGAERIEAL
jgi:hypothetical protein